MDERRYLDLPGEAVTLLSNPPVREKALLEATAFMCREHRGAANAVVAERFRRAEVSNRLGWEAIVRASKRLSAPMRRPYPVAGGRPGPRPGARPPNRRRMRR